MEKRKTLVRALGGVLIGGMLLSGGMAFAGDSNGSDSDTITKKIPFFGRAGKHLGGIGKGGQLNNEAAQKQKQQQISDSLKALVENDTITQEQSDKILQQFEAAGKDRKALFDKMENMTLKEIRQYMQANKGKISGNPIGELVTDGIITQDQANAIGEIIFNQKGYKGGHKGFKGGRF